MRLACGICLSSRSEARGEATPADADWVAVTDCGHVYHAVRRDCQRRTLVRGGRVIDRGQLFTTTTTITTLHRQSCLNQWLSSKPADARMCPIKCEFRNVKCDKRRVVVDSRGQAVTLRSTRPEPMPLLKLFLTDAGAAPSSDAVLPASESDAEGEAEDVEEDEEGDVKPPPRKRLRRNNKGKARVIDDDDDEEELPLSEVPPVAGPSSERPSGNNDDNNDNDDNDDDNDMRRQWMQAMATVREQRAEIERLKQARMHLRMQRVPGATSDGSDNSSADDDVECVFARLRDRGGSSGSYASNDDDLISAGQGADCRCRRCRPRGRTRRQLKARITELEAQLETRVVVALEQEEAYAAETSRLRDEVERLRVVYDELSQDFVAASNDYQTARVKWREAESAFKLKLEQSGENGAARIERLRGQLAEREREITQCVRSSLHEWLRRRHPLLR